MTSIVCHTESSVFGRKGKHCFLCDQVQKWNYFYNNIDVWLRLDKHTFWVKMSPCQCKFEYWKIEMSEFLMNQLLILSFFCIFTIHRLRVHIASLMEKLVHRDDNCTFLSFNSTVCTVLKEALFLHFTDYAKVSTDPQKAISFLDFRIACISDRVTDTGIRIYSYRWDHR